MLRVNPVKTLLTMPKHILIVDDDPDDVELFIDGVRNVDETIQCSRAVNGHDALQQLRLNPDFRPDYIFIDLNMPRLNGKQLLAELKKFPELRNIPSIIYTTSKLKQDKDETRLLGAVHFITKPYRLEDLCESIRFVLAEEWKKKPTHHDQ
jgi:CheY-like chemotaxis protein